MSNLGWERRRGASHTAASGAPAAGCGSQSAGRSPHSDTVSPLLEGESYHVSEVYIFFCLRQWTEIVFAVQTVNIRSHGVTWILFSLHEKQQLLAGKNLSDDSVEDLQEARFRFKFCVALQLERSTNFLTKPAEVTWKHRFTWCLLDLSMHINIML